jgi:hypothetical protein
MLGSTCVVAQITRRMTEAEMIGASKPGLLEPLYTRLFPDEEIEGLWQAPQGTERAR